MSRRRLVVGALLAVSSLVYAGNCVKNVMVGARVAKICPALLASTTERYANLQPFFGRMFEADAPRFQQMPDVIVGQVCTRLERELVWYRWNLLRKVKMDETWATRAELIAIIDRAAPTCVERMTRGIEGTEKLHLEIASASCPMLKTMRAALEARAHDASPWAVATQLERMVPSGAQVAERRGR
ncbi:MAG: hypothetical protein IAE78_28190 [Myxococcus sp.]|nr:hypothetical protein [Myxococcus sp.]